jgi:hypothetical protein
VRYVYSHERQADVIKEGYLPIDGPKAKFEAAKVGIEIELQVN